MYGYVNKTILTAAFYATIFPFGLLMETIGLILFYFIVNNLFRTRYRYPIPLSGKHSQITRSTIAWVPIIINAGFISYNYMLDNKNKI